MELHKLTGRAGADPKAAVRILCDTNVAAPALRWLALGSAKPQSEVVEAFRWMQRCALSANVRRVDLRFDLYWAAYETSRNHGMVDGDRLANMAGAHQVLLDWLWSVTPVAQRFEGERPRLRPSQRIRAAAHKNQDDSAIDAGAISLIMLSRIHRLRQNGELRGPAQRLQALEQWSEAIKPLGALSADVVLIAIQTALGGDGAPARAMCKFNQYVDVTAARAAAANAAWDLQFLRLMRCSEAGLPPYPDPYGPTTLLTFDKHLAAAASDLAYEGQIVGTAGGPATVGTWMNSRAHLQNDVLRDSAMLDRLDSWCHKMAVLQRDRWDEPNTMTRDSIHAMLEDTLKSTFPT